MFLDVFVGYGVIVEVFGFCVQWLYYLCMVDVVVFVDVYVVIGYFQGGVGVEGGDWFGGGFLLEQWYDFCQVVEVYCYQDQNDYQVDVFFNNCVVIGYDYVVFLSILRLLLLLWLLCMVCQMFIVISRVLVRKIMLFSNCIMQNGWCLESFWMKLQVRVLLLLIVCYIRFCMILDIYMVVMQSIVLMVESQK